MSRLKIVLSVFAVSACLTLLIGVSQVQAGAAVPCTCGEAVADGGCAVPVGAMCQGYPVTCAGTSGQDDITGTDGDDVIAAGKDDDIIDAKGGSNVICAGQGDDYVTTEDVGENNGDPADVNKIYLGHGDDDVDCGDGDNEIHGGQDDDNIMVGDGDNTIDGGRGTDTCVAGTGTNVIDCEM